MALSGHVKGGLSFCLQTLSALPVVPTTFWLANDLVIQ